MALDGPRRKRATAEADTRDTTGNPGLQGFTHPEDRIASEEGSDAHGVSDLIRRLTSEGPSEPGVIYSPRGPGGVAAP